MGDQPTGTGFRRRAAPLAEARSRFFTDLRGRIGGRPVVLWGAGRAGEIALASLRAEGCAPTWVADGDAARHGADFNGLRIGPPAQLQPPSPADPGEFAVLASMYAPEMAEILESRGWVRGRDFVAFPCASIYQPDVGFLLLELVSRSVPSPLGTDSRGSVGCVTLLASSRGGFFFRELRAFLAGGLRMAGWDVVEADERASAVSGIPIVIGPHEFFSIGEGVEWLSTENLEGSVLVATEQPQSLWFREFAPAWALAAAVVDISPNGAEAWRRIGVQAEWLPLGWYDGCDPFDCVPSTLNAPAGVDVPLASGPLAEEPVDRWEDRPIDVLFVGAWTPRRERMLRDLRERLADRRWFVHMPSDRDPLQGAGRAAIDTATFVALARRSKVLLNVHRDDAPFWEWQRIVWRGLWQRALVVTEPTGITVHGVEAGRDFIEAGAAEIDAALRDVFSSPGRSDTIRRSGWHRSRSEFSFAATARVLERAVARAAGQ